ncbi:MULTISPECIES: hypothetical protein [Rhodococcus]|uniref:Uncharacterized protein n=1 Tax=Rhodococcus cerastii TaxID=908616 RepID=A0ABU4D2V8_9NOCA|nr:MULTISPECIES: hypothetical protein [Rhodococcus]MDV6304055.1 hypothetical protein [Rhodococcus cerastii]MDV8056728.1 hypothetical protein [Rhodococcus sp. IEGM 1343]MDV8076649.1 hypothetical protein [Rhodococcus sp. IEGM 1370]
MADNIPAAASMAQPTAVPAVDREPCPAESGRPGWALLGLLLAVSAAIAIMALGISAG